MRPDWLQATIDAIRRDDHRNVLAGAVAGLGAGIAVGGMEWFSLAAHYPLVIIPFATSIVLVIGSPEAEPAQPRALIGGHLVATLAGLAVLQLTGPHAWAAAAAVGLAIGGMEWFSLAAHYPLVIIPFATSIVLVIGSPEAEPAQPRALIGGHVVATLAGLAVLQLAGPHAWAAAAAVGLAILAMHATGTFHPPAGINPMLVVSNSLPWTFLLAPVLAGAVLLTGFAYVWHRWIRRRRWPQRWL